MSRKIAGARGAYEEVAAILEVHPLQVVVKDTIAVVGKSLRSGKIGEGLPGIDFQIHAVIQSLVVGQMTVVELGIRHRGSSINLAVYDSHRVAAGICLGVGGVGIEVHTVVSIGCEYEFHVARTSDGDCACRRVSFDGSAAVGCACHYP